MQSRTTNCGGSGPCLDKRCRFLRWHGSPRMAGSQRGLLPKSGRLWMCAGATTAQTRRVCGVRPCGAQTRPSPRLRAAAGLRVCVGKPEVRHSKVPLRAAWRRTPRGPNVVGRPGGCRAPWCEPTTVVGRPGRPARLPHAQPLTQARSTVFASLASRPVRGQPSA